LNTRQVGGENLCSNFSLLYSIWKILEWSLS